MSKATILTILIAPACFKGTLSAPDVAEIMRDFLKERLGEAVQLITCPIADGGDDTLSVLQTVESDAELKTVSVTGPVAGTQVAAQYLWWPHRKTVVIESAQAHGLKLLGGCLAPMQATSYGVGELVRQAAMQCQPETIVVTVGGSASTDGGLGALQALGVGFEDEKGVVFQQPIGGEALSRIQRVIWPNSWTYAGRLIIATDVINPLLGPDGTAAVFAPQKGANAEQCQQLEAGLTHVNELMRANPEVDLSSLPGAGAAGGLAYGLRHLPRSGIVSGSHWISEASGLWDKLAQADLILTGEGRFDSTSLGGKATGMLLVWAEDKPVLIFCGQAEAGLTFSRDIEIFPLANCPEAVVEAIANPEAALLTQLEAALPRLKSRLRQAQPRPAL